MGKLETQGDDILVFCGVPFNAALWALLKANRLDEELPQTLVAELEQVK